MAARIASTASNWLDRIVGYISPQRGLQRHMARARMGLVNRAFEGASMADGWRPRRAGAAADQDHAADAWSLRMRSRALQQNVPYIAQAMRSLVASTIGTGIVSTFKGQHADTLNPLFNRWTKECDADGRLDWYGLQAAAYRAMEGDGEVLLRLRPRLVSDGLAAPLQLQLLEIDYLDSGKTNTTAGGNPIINGIEYDAIGRPAAYWMFPQHPGAAGIFGPNASRRVPAQLIIHMFTPGRPSQGRGFPRLAPVIHRVRDLQLYDDSELARKNLETRLSVLAHGDLDGLTGPNGAGAAENNEPIDLGALPSGAVVQMPGSTGFTVVQPTAAPGYTDYVKQQLHLIAAGFGVPYEMMTGDMREVNFSSARIRNIDFRREVEMCHWHTIIPQLVDRVAAEFETAAFLARLVPKTDYNVQHSTPKWDYVNPEQEVSADLAEISGGLSSISEKLRRRGYAPEAVFAELQSDVEALKQAGLLDLLVMLQTKKPTPEATAAANQSAH